MLEVPYIETYKENTLSMFTQITNYHYPTTLLVTTYTGMGTESGFFKCFI